MQLKIDQSRLNRLTHGTRRHCVKTYLKEVLEWLIHIGMKLSNILCKLRNGYRLGVYNLGNRAIHFCSRSICT